MTVAVASTALWSTYKSQRLGIPAQNIAVVGCPRVDQFTAIPREEALTRLGLVPERRTILWLPTYRAANGPHGRTLSDADSLSTSAAVDEIMRRSAGQPKTYLCSWWSSRTRLTLTFTRRSAFRYSNTPNSQKLV